jgi:hypothetical protein
MADAKVGDLVRDTYDHYGNHGADYGKVIEVRQDGNVLVEFIDDVNGIGEIVKGITRVTLNRGRYMVKP